VLAIEQAISSWLTDRLIRELSGSLLLGSNVFRNLTRGGCRVPADFAQGIADFILEVLPITREISVLDGGAGGAQSTCDSLLDDGEISLVAGRDPGDLGFDDGGRLVLSQCGQGLGLQMRLQLGRDSEEVDG